MQTLSLRSGLNSEIKGPRRESNARFTSLSFAMKESACHDHHHSPNRVAVVPMHVRLDADPNYTGKGVTIAFLDSGFYPHADLLEPESRILAYHDLAQERPSLDSDDPVELWQWHGTQTSVAAAGNGRLSDGVYRGLASDAHLVLIKASTRGRITEENIARGIEWVIENRERYNKIGRAHV